MSFPVAKLGSLLLRQLSKPIANYAKERAKSRPFFRNYVCMPPAQFYNWCEIKMRMWVMNLGKPVDIPKLNEAMAIELGANLLGESIIFGIAAVLLFLEYSRQVRKEAAKETARVEELTNITMAIRDLTLQADRQDAQLRELMRQIVDLESRVIHRPFAPRSPPKTSGPSGDSDNPQTPSQHPPRNSYQPNTADWVEPVVPIKSSMMVTHDVNSTRYKGGAILDALDYITFRIPNGYTR